MTDHAEELRRALESCRSFSKKYPDINSQYSAVARLGVDALAHLPTVLAELEELRRQHSTHITTGFDDESTRNLK